MTQKTFGIIDVLCHSIVINIKQNNQTKRFSLNKHREIFNIKFRPISTFSQHMAQVETPAVKRFYFKFIPLLYPSQQMGLE